MANQGVDQGMYQAFKAFLLKEKETIVEDVGDPVKKGVDSPTTVVEEEATLIKQFKKLEQISVEIVYEPEVLDAHDDWASEYTILKACENFNKNLASGNAKPNLFHVKPETEKLEILRTYVLPCECTIGSTVVKKGTWVAEIKWKDDVLWKKRTVPNEDGVLEISGLSLQGMGIRILPNEGVEESD